MLLYQSLRPAVRVGQEVTTVRILIADGDGGYRQSTEVVDEFADRLASRLGTRPPVRVQWPEPDAIRLRRPRTWRAASAAGVADLARLVRLHPSDPLVLVGCMCGSRIIHDWMDAYPDQLDRVAAVGLISDPFRPAGRTTPGVPDPGGQGVAGTHLGPIPDRTFWASVPGDPMSGVQRGSLLRAVVRDSQLTVEQVYRDLLHDLPDSRTQLAARLHVFHHPSNWTAVFGRDLEDARATLLRFADRAHLADYTVPGADGRSVLDHLEDQIVSEVLGEAPVVDDVRVADDSRTIPENPAGPRLAS